MPIHPQIASKLHPLEGLTSFETATSDPAQRAKLDEFVSITGAPLPPQVDTHDRTVDGPHGPVPVRVHRPADPGPERPALVWVHGGAFVGRAADGEDVVLTELDGRYGTFEVAKSFTGRVVGLYATDGPVPFADFRYRGSDTEEITP